MSRNWVSWRGIFAPIFLALALGWQASASGIGPQLDATMLASKLPPVVSRIIVLQRNPIEPHVLAGSVVQPLSVTAGIPLTAGARHWTGGRVFDFRSLTSIDEAKRILGRLRMRPDVVWAEFDPDEVRSEAAQSARKEALASVAGIVRLVVTFDDTQTQRLSRANDRLDLEWSTRLSLLTGVTLVVGRPTMAGAWVVELPSSMSYNDAMELADKIVSSGLALYAEPDLPVHPHIVPNDPGYLQAPQWGLYDPNSSPNYGINAPQAWDTTTGDPNLVVAIVDTGVLPHPELGTRILQGYSFVSVANSHDGLGPHASGIDPGDWRSATDCPRNPKQAPSSWHGTHVAGIIAATGNNGSGIAGINWQSKILPVRVLGTCGGTTLDIIEGMYWAAGGTIPGVPPNPTPAKVINMSLGGSGTCSPYYQAIVNEVLASGALVVASAGNDDGIADNQVPGACIGLSTVGATGPYGDRAPYSNFSYGLDISAPGGDLQKYGADGGIWSTINLGATTAAGYGYRDYQGTSQAAPHVSGVASLMYSVNPNLTPAQVKQIMGDTSHPFAPGSICDSDICGAGIVNASAAVGAAKAALGKPSPVVNYTGLWWSYPAESESGWGINFAHQGNLIFASWFTYDLSGKGSWLVMTAQRVAGAGNDAFTGTLYSVTGPSFNSVPFNPSATRATSVGSGTLIFDDDGFGSFIYTVNGTVQAKSVVREVFGPLPICTFGAQPNLTLATNFTDLWWASPPGSESGWGVNLTHQGTTIFATWFTFDLDGSPMWLVVTAQLVRPNEYTGTLYQTRGPPFNAVPFNPGLVTGTPVGNATFIFANGNAAIFNYTAKNVSQSKQIVREVLVAPGTTCQ